MKKKPETQKVGGALTSSIHFWKKASRRSMSVTYEPSGLSDGYERFIHSPGRAPSVSAEARVSSSASMTTRPLMAFLSELSDERTIEMSRLKRMSSCASTVFMLSR